MHLRMWNKKIILRGGISTEQEKMSGGNEFLMPHRDDDNVDDDH